MEVDAGSVDENEAQSGVAHMVEHMVFRGSEAYPSSVANMLHQKGWIRAQHLLFFSTTPIIRTGSDPSRITSPIGFSPLGNSFCNVF
ncbi:MAG: insulinase family protein [Symbiopectobacterium sp.]|uniref:insulinase family protein n=1 Tax=Symbiopectobacterium sp. TaxID=2952789 RepID=UPI003F2A31F3